MLPSIYRLTKPQDFTQIYKKGHHLSSPHLRLSFLKSGQNVTRFGFVVSKKQVSRIVDRNRIKRVLRDAIGKSRVRIPLGYNVVIQARPGTNPRAAPELRWELQELLKKAQLQKT